GSEYGLPGPGEENWRIFAIYRVSSFTKVKKCMSIYESERFLFLRQHCELYLLYGKELEHLEEGAHELV
ncbi:MAG: hypothetical protein ONB24_07325, partial [candidate division KSB1 bacterium]|nr:hypothetical protein [candidate division KSB1 bacterium]